MSDRPDQPDQWGAPVPTQPQGWSQSPPPDAPQQPWSSAPPPTWSPAPGTETSTLAIVGLCMSIANFVILPFIGSILGLIFGYMGRNEIRSSQGRMGNHGVATAAIVVGWVGIGLWVLAVVAFVLFFAAVTTVASVSLA